MSKQDIVQLNKFFELKQVLSEEIDRIIKETKR